MATKTKSKKLPVKEALKYALRDTLEVVFYTGVPATGVVAFLSVIETDIPNIAKYSPYIASGVNVIFYFVKRTVDYTLGKA